MMTLRRLSLLLNFLLLTSFHDVNAIEPSDAQMALTAGVKADDPKEIEIALKDGADINLPSPRGGQTPLMQSVLNGQVNAVKYLLSRGADASIGEANGYTPMHGAGFQGRVEIAEILLNHGVDPRHMHEDGYEPIHRACWGSQQRHTDTVHFFIEKAGVNVEEIYDQCTNDEKVKNPGTIKLLKQFRSTSDEL
uniref:Ankyrin repeat domain-containing protein n=1 Tax=Proboscia inermis TaxID=420281 RepID=A0A7S0GPA8_9STRA|mmetsp:Transcript_9960/g.10100  ORF Transcript_9960/g.10100 Transcript_9960/m.10100 type:complete len:193 (+) Transcript_9960:46-624(+)